jgi:bla regulator protein BlaR1
MNASSWLEVLGRASLEGAVLMLGVWAVCRLWPSLPAWARGGLWWVVAARLLLGLLPLAHFTVRAPLPVTAVWWPAAVAATAEAPPASPRALLGEPVTAVHAVTVSSVEGEPEPRSSSWTVPDWITPPVVLVLLWMAGLGVRALGLARQLRRVRRALRRARPADRQIVQALAPGSRVRLAISQEAPVPMVTGLLRPTVLIPAQMLDRPHEELRLAVAHELAHVRRGDLWLAWVPAVAETLFWFHPLVPWCVREYVQACEEACDQEALRATGATPYDYGRLLLAFGVHGRLAGATAMPCGSPSSRQLTRRLSMLKHFVPLKPGLRNVAVGLLCAFALVGLAPLRVVPTSADPTPAAASSSWVDPGSPAPLPAEPVHALSGLVVDQAAGNVGEGDESTPSPDDEDVPPIDEDTDSDSDLDDEWDVPAMPPAPPAPATPAARPARPAPAEPAAPAAPAPRAWAYPRTPRPALVPTPRAPRAARGGTSWGYDDAKRFAYVLVHPDGDSFSGSGNRADWAEVRRLERQLGHDFLWARIGDKRYLIEDREVLDQFEETFRPQQEIGQRQGELGGIQARIGEKQAQIGEAQARVGERQAEIGQRQAELAQQMAERQWRGQRARELELMAEELSAQMETLGHEQERLGARMEPLGRQQEELGSQMEALAREMERASQEGNRAMRALIEQAVRNGKATPLR